MAALHRWTGRFENAFLGGPDLLAGPYRVGREFAIGWRRRPNLGRSVTPVFLHFDRLGRRFHRWSGAVEHSRQRLAIRFQSFGKPRFLHRQFFRRRMRTRCFKPSARKRQKDFFRLGRCFFDWQNRFKWQNFGPLRSFHFRRNFELRWWRRLFRNSPERPFFRRQFRLNFLVTGSVVRVASGRDPSGRNFGAFQIAFARLSAHEFSRLADGHSGQFLLLRSGLNGKGSNSGNGFNYDSSNVG